MAKRLAILENVSFAGIYMRKKRGPRLHALYFELFVSIQRRRDGRNKNVHACSRHCE